MTPLRLLPAVILAFGLSCAVHAADAPARAPAATASAVMPSLTRPWTPEEYAVAANLVADRQVPLPTYATPQGKALLDKLTSADNYAIFVDETIPLLSRLQRTGVMFQGLGKLMITYGNVMEGGKNMHGEAAALVVTVLNMSALESDLAKQFFAKMDPANPRLAPARAQFGKGLEAICTGVLEAVSTPGYFLPAESTIELRTLADTIPSINVFLAPEVRVALSAKLAVQRKLATLPEDQKSLDRILAVLAA